MELELYWGAYSYWVVFRGMVIFSYKDRTQLRSYKE